MTGVNISTKLRAVLAAATVFTLAAASWAHAQQPVPAAVAKPAAVKPSMPAADKSLWKNLSPAQHMALAPLSAEWDKMEAARKLKWLEIANRFASMKPDEQQRVHDKMREWIKMTPEARRKVRENYTATKKIDKDQKSVQWEQYQQLTEEQKKQLTAEAKKKTPVTNLPNKNQSPAKPVAPIKSGKAAPTIVCPAGTIKNPTAAMPACVKAPEPAPVVVPPPAPTPLALPPSSTIIPSPPVNPASSVPNAK
jgi:hypothetical protein